MKADLLITFEDGTHKKITLEEAIEINTKGKQSISFIQTNKGTWIMSFTKSLFEDKKFWSIRVEKR